MKRVHIIACALLAAAAALATGVCYGSLPAMVPVHWNAAGEADRMGPRAMLWLLGPGLMAAMLGLGLCLPWLSPQRYRLDAFAPTWSYFIVVMVAMLGCLHLAVLRAIQDDGVDMARTIHGGLFVMLVLLGNPMGKVRPNFFVGVRTPWSLASEQVWHATHRLCGKLMVASGLLGLAAVALGAAGWLLSALAAGWAIVAVLFSLVHYKRLEKSGRLRAG